MTAINSDQKKFEFSIDYFRNPEAKMKEYDKWAMLEDMIDFGDSNPNSTDRFIRTLFDDQKGLGGQLDCVR